jgi:hypothetical protein
VDWTISIFSVLSVCSVVKKNNSYNEAMWIFFLLLLVTGCGYHWQGDHPHLPTITVPYAKGDEDGSLTGEIIETISTSGVAKVKNREADYRLQVEILDNQIDQIGYRRDPQKIKNKIKKNLLASENRRTLKIQATLFRGQTDEIAFGPYLLTADADYDYIDGDSFQDLTFINSDGILTTVLPFSLGQLESIESAQEAATKPIFRKISKKIVDVISAEW